MVVVRYNMRDEASLAATASSLTTPHSRRRRGGMAKPNCTPRTHCKRGHLLSGDNLHSWYLARGQRVCRVCINDRRAGRPMAPTMSAYDRVLARCVRVGECLVFQGATSTDGYGQISVNNRIVYVHRVVYEHHHGPVPNGMQIDHVKSRGCTSRRCCEIGHLEAVSPRENTMRSDAVTAVNARKTHCPQGHELSGDNLVKSNLRYNGARVCRTCRNERAKLRQREKRAIKGH